MIMGLFPRVACNIIAFFSIFLLKSTYGKYTTTIGACDVYKGNWVFDVHYSTYDASKCPFLETAFTCQKNGRPDKYYTKYRWQPQGCTLPKFDGRAFLSKHRGKRIVFVGDSLSLNQWQSLTCLLHVAAPEAPYKSVKVGYVSTFTFPTYGVSLEYSRNAFLTSIENEGDKRVMKLDTLHASREWQGADVLVFDTWHWWLHSGRKQPWDMLRYENTRVADMNRLEAYEKALTTWAKWIDFHVDPAKTKVFFQGISPDHGVCEKKSHPLPTQGPTLEEERVLEKVLFRMAKTVHLLDINGLSQLRHDGHPSVYGLGGYHGMDCTHWCLPGVPDTWNELLYAALN